MKNKNKKISIGLKKYHSHKIMKATVKKGLLIAIPLVLSICAISEMSQNTDNYISSFKPVYIAKGYNTPKEDKRSVVADSIKPELSVKEQIVKIAEAENFKYTDYLLRLLYCESRFDTKARNTNNRLGVDKGVAQINSYWHPTVKEEQADDLEFSVKFTMDKINAGYQRLWMCDDIVKGKSQEQLSYNY